MENNSSQLLPLQGKKAATSLNQKNNLKKKSNLGISPKESFLGKSKLSLTDSLKATRLGKLMREVETLHGKKLIDRKKKKNIDIEEVLHYILQQDVELAIELSSSLLNKSAAQLSKYQNDVDVEAKYWRSLFNQLWALRCDFLGSLLFFELRKENDLTNDAEISAQLSALISFKHLQKCVSMFVFSAPSERDNFRFILGFLQEMIFEFEKSIEVLYDNDNVTNS